MGRAVARIAVIVGPSVGRQVRVAKVVAAVRPLVRVQEAPARLPGVSSRVIVDPSREAVVVVITAVVRDVKVATPAAVVAANVTARAAPAVTTAARRRIAARMIVLITR